MYGLQTDGLEWPAASSLCQEECTVTCSKCPPGASLPIKIRDASTHLRLLLDVPRVLLRVGPKQDHEYDIAYVRASLGRGDTHANLPLHRKTPRSPSMKKRCGRTEVNRLIVQSVPNEQLPEPHWSFPRHSTSTITRRTSQYIIAQKKFASQWRCGVLEREAGELEPNPRKVCC